MTSARGRSPADIIRKPAVAVHDDDQPRAEPRHSGPPFDLGRHLSDATDAVQPDRTPGAAPEATQRLVALGRDSLHEGAVAVAVLHEQDQRFFDKPNGVLGGQFVALARIVRHAQSPAMQRRTPGVALEGGDEEFMHPFALKPAIP